MVKSGRFLVRYLIPLLKKLGIVFFLILFAGEFTLAQSFLKTIGIKSYSQSIDDKIYQAIRLFDGNYALIGETTQSGSSETKFLFIKISPDGNMLLRKSVGKSGIYKFRSALSSRFGEVYILGSKTEKNSPVMVCLAKIDMNGSLLWEGLSGGAENESISDMTENSDGKITLCGSKEIKGDHDTDAWILRYTRKGTEEFQELYGQRYIDDAFESVISDPAGNIFAIGFSSQKIGDEKIPFMVCLDDKGIKKWEKLYPGLARNIPETIIYDEGKIIFFSKEINASGEIQAVNKVILSSSGDLVQKITSSLPFEPTERSFIYQKDGKLVIISNPKAGSQPDQVQTLMMLDRDLTAIWIKKLNNIPVVLNSILMTENNRYLSTGISSDNKDTGSPCLYIYEDNSSKLIDDFISRRLTAIAGKKPNESESDFRNRIGDEKYEILISGFRSESIDSLQLYSQISRKKQGENLAVRSDSPSTKKTENVSPGSPALKGKYYALLIAINDYKDPMINSLDKPISDAQSLFDILVDEYLFEKPNVTFLKNPTREQIISNFDRLEKDLTKEDNLLIFYAGHGYWNDKNQKGYWLPSDATKANTSNWIGNSTICDYVKSIQCRHTLLIADACFSGSIFKTRAAFGGLDRTTQRLYELTSRKAMTSGTLTEVPDRSVFVEYLAKRLIDNKEHFLSSEQLFFSFKPAVLNNTENIPQFGVVANSGDEGGDFIFIRRNPSSN
jgi:uncharacterized caspase-like protein